MADPRITQEKFDEKLWELERQMHSSERESLPGYYEIISEHLNNDVIKALEDDLGITAEREVKAEAVAECYYADEKVCDGEVWECETCGQRYCLMHNHDTELGCNVECVACERQRKEDPDSI